MIRSFRFHETQVMIRAEQRLRRKLALSHEPNHGGAQLLRVRITDGSRDEDVGRLHRLAVIGLIGLIHDGDAASLQHRPDKCAL